MEAMLAAIGRRYKRQADAIKDAGKKHSPAHASSDGGTRTMSISDIAKRVRSGHMGDGLKAFNIKVGGQQ